MASDPKDPSEAEKGSAAGLSPACVTGSSADLVVEAGGSS